MGTHLRVLYYPINSNIWQGLDGIQKSLHPYFWGDSSFNIGRVKVMSAMPSQLKALSQNTPQSRITQ